MSKAVGRLPSDCVGIGYKMQAIRELLALLDALIHDNKIYRTVGTRLAQDDKLVITYMKNNVRRGKRHPEPY